MFGNFRGWEILILVLIVLLLFGSKKLPDAARGIGRSLRIFKAETKGLMDDDANPDGKSGEAPAAIPAADMTQPQVTATPPAAPPVVPPSPPISANAPAAPESTTQSAPGSGAAAAN